MMILLFGDQNVLLLWPFWPVRPQSSSDDDEKTIIVAQTQLMETQEEDMNKKQKKRKRCDWKLIEDETQRESSIWGVEVVLI